MISQIVFLILLSLTVYIFYKNAQKIRKNILLGKKYTPKGSKKDRFKQMVLIALGQKKMFKKPIPALLHLFVYLGFLLVNIELLEIICDGLFAKHRIFKPFLGEAYHFLINFFEFFAVAVLLVCVVFLIRRNVLQIKRFFGGEMTKWPKLDANLILVFEIVLMFFLLNMNATDTAIQLKAGGEATYYWASALFVPLYDNASLDGLHLAERFYWWAHIIGVFVFANYVLYSKHLHIFLAFPNTFFTNILPKGKIENMDAITQEVKLMLDPTAVADDALADEGGSFGAKDVQDLSWKNLLEAYSCTECGRCTSNCPANLTGKKLSPRKIMMDTRDRIEEVGQNREKHGEDYQDEKSLIDDYITEEEILACTTCNACVEACPVNINPLSIITELRRYKTMEEAKVPSEWNGMYQNVETSFNPWKFPPSDRANWMESMKNS